MKKKEPPLAALSWHPGTGASPAYGQLVVILQPAGVGRRFLVNGSRAPAGMPTGAIEMGLTDDRVMRGIGEIRRLDFVRGASQRNSACRQCGKRDQASDKGAVELHADSSLNAAHPAAIGIDPPRSIRVKRTQEKSK